MYNIRVAGKAGGLWSEGWGVVFKRGVASVCAHAFVGWGGWEGMWVRVGFKGVGRAVALVVGVRGRG